MLESELASSRYHVCQFSGKTHNFDFFDPNLPKKELEGLEFQKINFEIRISSISADTMCANFQTNGQLGLFEPKFAQKWILRSEFQKSKSGFGISTSSIP